MASRWLNSFIVPLLLTLTINIHSEIHHATAAATVGNGFVQTTGTKFVVNGEPFYLNGFNAYWLTMFASDPSSRSKVTDVFREASKYGMNVARTWGFNDGDYNPLQTSPGSYNEDAFKGLDFVVAEANKYGIHLIMSLANNFKDYGGKDKYVQWAKQRGRNLTNEDDFFTDSVVKQYYKDHVKAVLTRINTITGVAYKDDPSIFAWELMNEPRCPTDPSGAHLQSWIKEMATHVKSIDNHHLLEIGLEGFYGESIPEKKQYNPNNYPIGTDFISDNQIAEVDFATIHIYPEQWLPPTNMSEEAQRGFVDRWIESHAVDCNSVLKKPLVIGEFGKSFKLPGYSLEKRNEYFQRVYNAIYSSARSGGSCAGGLFWQLLSLGMDTMGDGYQVVLEQSPSTASIIAQQSRLLSSLT
ncbi:Mannan endo-1,4-beta-mannosidase 1 [Hibiscus syriacus]|uniref:mannan endo-1,4-beta-mannosidase n=1 Tax=Hibiscus syriacus TaxID=106335 RepID=A0A6A3A5N7_HIBSY|nr:mannan endo-1,4-beta-mannosidase 4-like [Hibiscus syriacus]KAE8699654.1 Mannan endo-1,4-beta-mannosidase 1 [Hibiscus syriacus]